MAFPGDDDFMEEAYAAWGEGSRLDGPVISTNIQWKLVVLWWHIIGPLLNITLLVLGSGLIVLAYRLEEESLEQLIAIEFAAGIATYLVTPIALAMSLRWRMKARLVMVIGAAVCADGAVWMHSVTRHLLVESCSGLLLVVALEMTVHEWVKWIRNRQKGIDARAATERTLNPGID
jgi:hypothetical protein